jgi:hypothetical protein
MTFGRNLGLMYPLIAFAALMAGIFINRASGQSFSGNVDPASSFIFLLLIYSVLHVAAISVAAVIGHLLAPHPRSTVYLVLSLAAFVASVWVLLPGRNGVHLLVIFAGSLALIATYYFWLVHGRVQEGA